MEKQLLVFRFTFFFLLPCAKRVAFSMFLLRSILIFCFVIFLSPSDGRVRLLAHMTAPRAAACLLAGGKYLLWCGFLASGAIAAAVGSSTSAAVAFALYFAYVDSTMEAELSEGPFSDLVSSARLFVALFVAALVVLFAFLANRGQRSLDQLLKGEHVCDYQSALAAVGAGGGGRGSGGDGQGGAAGGAGLLGTLPRVGWTRIVFLDLTQAILDVAFLGTTAAALNTLQIGGHGENDPNQGQTAVATALRYYVTVLAAFTLRAILQEIHMQQQQRRKDNRSVPLPIRTFAYSITGSIALCRVL